MNYKCINNFKGAFTKGVVYEGHVDKLIPTGIMFKDNNNVDHTITARLFNTLFVEVK